MEQTLKREEEVWITPIVDERFWMVVVWLMSQAEVREALLTPAEPVLPVIPY